MFRGFYLDFNQLAISLQDLQDTYFYENLFDENNSEAAFFNATSYCDRLIVS